MKRPNPVLYHAVWPLLKGYAYFKGQRITRYDTITRPCILLSNHTSFHDFIYTTTAVYPNRVTYLAAEKMLYLPDTKLFLKLARVIPKPLFHPDAVSIRKTFTILKKKGIIGIFPEGQISDTGKALKPPYAVAKLVKKANVDVFTVTHEGAYQVNPPWTKKSFKGKITTQVKRIIRKEELANLSSDSIYKIITDHLNIDTFSQTALQTVKRVDIRGLEALINRCPSCKAIAIQGHKDMLKCLQCGHELRVDSTLRLNGKTIQSYYEHQTKQLIEELKANTLTLNHPVILESYVKRRVKQVGRGTIKLDEMGYTYEGTIHNNPVHLHFDPVFIPYLPSDIGKNIQIYHDNQLYQFVFYESAIPIMYVALAPYLHQLASKRHQGTK